MLLTVQHSYELLVKHGIFAREICDKCGLVLGAVRFTQSNEYGVWCSRECRDGATAHDPGTCRYCHAKLPEGKRKGSGFCDESCRVGAHRGKTAHQAVRTSKLSVTKPSIYAAFSSGKVLDGIPGHPAHFGAF